MSPTCAFLPTCPIYCTVLVGVQSEHVTNGPHVVPQHDAPSLDHKVVRVGCQRNTKTGH